MKCLRFQLTSALLTALGIAFLVWKASSFSGGFFVYTLDDPYIHLAVAESILDGGYGVNANEFASPSSSILYPFLLSGLLAIGLGTWGPLLLSGAAMIWSVWLLSGLAWRQGIGAAQVQSQVIAYAMLPLGILAINGLALPLTGMDHPLHILAVAMTLVGLERLGIGPWHSALLMAGLVLGPFIRFEGLALTAAGIAVLLWYKHYVTSAVVGLIVVAGSAVYVLAMMAVGLPPVPSSVMVKSHVPSILTEQDTFSGFAGLINQTLDAIRNPRGMLLLAASVGLLIGISFRTDQDKTRIAVASVAVVALAGHIAAGRYGWFSRYEIYAVALALGALAIVWGPLLRSSERAWAVWLGVMIALTGTAVPYARTTLLTPAASHGIFLQQYQMHRFATDFFPFPVAVNDLGYVSFDNEQHVLDLWGLGSDEARVRRAQPGFGADDLRALARPNGTVYAMIYDTWLGDAVPAEWCRIGELQ
ncbi:MAG: hypothetical protein AAFO68_07240, partial [Pseudomonadota bacterium]